MSAASTTTSKTLALTEEERETLLSFLEQALRDKQVEIHRTEAFEYRKRVENEGAVLQSLIDKLRQ